MRISRRVAHLREKTAVFTVSWRSWAAGAGRRRLSAHLRVELRTFVRRGAHLRQNAAFLPGCQFLDRASGWCLELRVFAKMGHFAWFPVANWRFNCPHLTLSRRERASSCASSQKCGVFGCFWRPRGSQGALPGLLRLPELRGKMAWSSFYRVTIIPTPFPADPCQVVFLLFLGHRDGRTIPSECITAFAATRRARGGAVACCANGDRRSVVGPGRAPA